MTIQDSGERRQFDSGAVRDIQTGKGRCDLLPLDVIADLLYDYEPLRDISAFVADGDTDHLLDAARAFIRTTWPNGTSAMLSLSRHFEDGATKYGERNWERGIPTHCYIDSAVRHYIKHMRGDTDERHDRAFLWNVLCCAWTVRHLPEMDDLPHQEETA